MRFKKSKRLVGWLQYVLEKQEAFLSAPTILQKASCCISNYVIYTARCFLDDPLSILCVSLKSILLLGICPLTLDGVGCLKKSFRAAGIASNERREIVRSLAAAYPVQMLCEVVDLPPSTYYYQSQKDKELDLRAALEGLAGQHPRMARAD